jgi:hypothetical protein
MAQYNWEEFLWQWSKDLVVSQTFAEELTFNQEQYPPDVLKSGWLGYAGANEKQLAELENKLKTELPPSYREFLKVSNGWRFTGNFVDQIWSTEQVDWLKNSKRDTPNTAEGFALWDGNLRQEDAHQSYRQKVTVIPAAQFSFVAEALEISDFERGGSAQYFLMPQLVDANGEWEAWFYAHWLPGVIRFASFWDLMQREYQGFLAAEEGRVWRKQKEIEAAEQKQARRSKFGIFSKIFR